MIHNALVAGVDSSTRACKVVIRDADTGAVLRRGAAPHPAGTEVHPSAWWEALGQAVAEAGGLEDVAAVSIAGQQHGMVCLDDEGAVVRPALLWNDTRSARPRPILTELAELPPGGRRGRRRPRPGRAASVGPVAVASPSPSCAGWPSTNRRRAKATAAVCLPHDWLTWRLTDTDGRDISTLTTDRSDASGTGYFSPAVGAYRPDLLQLAFGRRPLLPRVLGPAEPARSCSRRRASPRRTPRACVSARPS